MKWGDLETDRKEWGNNNMINPVDFFCCRKAL